MSGIDSLYSERDKKYAEKQECERVIAEIDEKIDYLIKFKGQLDDYRIYDYNEASCPAINLAFMCCNNWHGEKNNWLSNFTKDILCTDLMSYENILGQMRDDLCDEITSLENERYKKECFLGSINSSLDSIANAIEKNFM